MNNLILHRGFFIVGLGFHNVPGGFVLVKQRSQVFLLKINLFYNFR